MSEELSMNDPQDTPEVTPEVEPDPVAEKEAALAKREAELKKFEEKLNKRSTELGLTAKELEAAREAYASKAQPEEDEEYDPEQLKVLKGALKKLGIDPDLVSSTVTTTAEREAEEFRITGDTFFEAHDDVTPDELFGFLSDLGVAPPKTAARLKMTLERGYKLYKAEQADPEAAATELAAKKLAELAEKDERVVSVKPKRSGVADGKKSVDQIVADQSMGFFQKAELLEGLED